MRNTFAKKWHLVRAWAGGHPIWCAWQVTYRCNFRCRFCHYWAGASSADSEPSVSAYADGARKLSRLGSIFISLAGGEPLLRPDLPEIVEAVARWHMPFVTTNGWLATPEAARAIMKAGAWGVSVSIDYADPARHDARRGMAGAWEQAWRAVEMFRDARLHHWQRVNVIAVLMDDNIDHIQPLLELANRYGAFFMVQPYGELKTRSTAYVHNDGPVSPRLLELRWRYRNFLSNPGYLAQFDRFLGGGVPGCKAGRAFFNIDETGDVAICVEMRHKPVANLFRDHIGVIRKRLAAAARDNACTGCWYNCRGEVENLYNPRGFIHSVPLMLVDRWRTPRDICSAAGRRAGRESE